MDHCSNQIVCTEQPQLVREGISDTDWKDITTLVKAQRGLKSFDKEEHEIDRWFKIWDVLFPGIQRPSNPCK